MVWDPEKRFGLEGDRRGWNKITLGSHVIIHLEAYANDDDLVSLVVDALNLQGPGMIRDYLEKQGGRECP